MKKLISIIIPVFNSEKWLERCIDSVINQTYKRIEIILIDDGSTDSSPLICDNYAKKDKRIKVIHQKNKGVSSARNAGIKESKGYYVKFVDSDDSIVETCCEEMISNFSSDIDLIICGLNVYKNNILLRTPHLDNKTLNIKLSVDNFQYISRVFASPCNKLYKKELLNNYDEKMTAGEDMLFNLNYLKKCQNVKCIEKCLYNVFLDNDNSLNRKFRDDRLDISLLLLKSQIDFCNIIYGNNNYDQTFLKNYCILNLHSFFRDVSGIYNYKKYKEVLKKYLKNDLVHWSLKGFKLDRLDYRIFGLLLKYNLIYLSYIFFKFKKMVNK